MKAINKFPKIVQDAWTKVYNESAKKFGIDNAELIANKWVESRFVKSGESYIASSADFTPIEILSFQLTPSDTEFIMNSIDGEFIMNATLSSIENWVDKEGNKLDIAYTEECLKDFEKQINDNGLTLPDIEHKEFDEVLNTYVEPKQIMEELAKRKGLLKDIKAKYDNGKLFISAKLDKRYHKYAEFYQNISLEALAKRDGNKYVGGKILGFTFTKSPRVKSATIDSI